MIVTHFAESRLPVRGLPAVAFIAVLIYPRGDGAGRRLAGPLFTVVLSRNAAGYLFLAAAVVIAAQTLVGSDAPRKSATVASLIAVPMAGEVAWSR
jgi:hypothetical protein